MSRAARALFAFAAALALLAAQAVSALHFAFVPHHLCGIHGTLEDGAASVGVASHSVERASTAVTDADAPEGAHEACGVAALHKHAVVVPPAVAVPVAVSAEVAATEGGGADVKPDRASILARAPKLSPPCVG